MAVRRLTALEQAAWGGLLSTHAALWRTMEQRLAASGLSMTDYDVLVALEGAGRDGVRMSDLASRSRMSSGGFSRLADRLARQGLIERRPCDTDGRGYLAFVTPEGLRTLRRARTTHLDDVRELFLSHLSEDDLRHLAAVWAQLDAGRDEAAAGSERAAPRPRRPRAAL
jgi:DNA-binding MarR family transcriptional regulator